MKQINESKFSSLVDIPTPPIVREIEWWASPVNRVLGTVLLDLIDKDFSWVILGRDEVGRYRAIDLGVSLPSQEEAQKKMLEKMAYHYKTGQDIFPQHDN